MSLKKSLISLILICSLALSLASSVGFAAASYDPYEEFVSRLYVEALGRTSYGANEINYWSNLLRTGRSTAASVVNSFFFSEEMIGRNLTNEQYVRAMYRAIMVIA